MTEKQLRDKIVNVATGYYGLKASDGSHRQIIDIYNANPPLARGYKMKYTDAWCACFVSVVAIRTGTLKIIPKEVSCNCMIELFKKIGRWEENDNYIPDIGDIIFYDWQDNGIGENTGTSEHVGIVVSVTDSIIKVIEGNMSNAVGYNNIAINGRYIRGYGLPDYANMADEENVISTTPTIFTPYIVKIMVDSLNIRKGPGTNHTISGSIKNKGLYTIVEESTGVGAKRWGKLKSGAGWISLDYTEKR